MLFDIEKTRVKDPGFGAAKATPPDMSLEGLLLGRADLEGVVFDQQLKPRQIDLKLLSNFELRVWWLLFIDRGYNYKDAVLTIQNYYKLFAAEYEVDGTEESYVQGLRQFFAKKIEEAVWSRSTQAEKIKDVQMKRIALNLVSKQLSYLIDNYFFLATSYQEWSNLACVYHYLFESNLSKEVWMEKLQAVTIDNESLMGVVRNLINFMEQQQIDRNYFHNFTKSDIANFSLFGRFLKLWPKLNIFMEKADGKELKVVYMIKFLLIPNNAINIVDKLSLLEMIHFFIGNEDVRFLDQLSSNLDDLVAIRNLLFFEDSNGSRRVEIDGLLYKNGSYKVFKFIL